MKRCLLAAAVVTVLAAAGYPVPYQIAQAPSEAQSEIARVLDRAVECAMKIEDTAARSETLVAIASQQLLAGNYEGVRRTAGKLSMGKERAFLFALLAGKERQAKDTESADAALRQAQESLPPIERADERREAQSHIVLGLAAGRDTAGVRKTLDTITDVRTNAESLVSLVEAGASSEDVGGPVRMIRDALKKAEGILDGAARDQLFVRIALCQAEGGDPQAALKTLDRVRDPKVGPEALGVKVSVQAFLGDLKSARKTAESIPSSAAKDRALSAIAKSQARQDAGAALSTIESIQSDAQKVVALLAIGNGQREAEKKTSLERASKLAEDITDPKERADAFAAIVEDHIGRGSLSDAQTLIDKTRGCAVRGGLLASLACERVKAGEVVSVREWADKALSPNDQAWILTGLASGMIELEANALDKQRAEQAEKLVPPRFPTRLSSGKFAGELVLGVTTLDEARKLFPNPGGRTYEGDPRKPTSEPDVKIGDFRPRAALVYNPWATMYALYFDENKRLIMIRELGDKLEGLTREEITKRYPSLKELKSTSKARPIELQGEIGPDVVLCVAIESEDKKVAAVIYVFTGKTAKP